MFSHAGLLGAGETGAARAERQAAGAGGSAGEAVGDAAAGLAPQPGHHLPAAAGAAATAGSVWVAGVSCRVSLGGRCQLQGQFGWQVSAAGSVWVAGVSCRVSLGGRCHRHTQDTLRHEP